MTDCDNLRGVTLLYVPSKLFRKVLINHIRVGVDQELRDEQAGFRKGRSTLEQLFILQNIIEQLVEWQVRLYKISLIFKSHSIKFIGKAYGIKLLLDAMTYMYQTNSFEWCNCCT